MPQQAGIIGDNVGIDLPITQVDTESLDNERKMARFSKTDEFKRLKKHLEERIDFYEKFLPDGRPITAGENMVTTGQNWVVANAIIAELKAILEAYEIAKEVVKDANK